MARDIARGHHCWTSGRPGNGLGGRTGPRKCDDQALTLPSAGRKSMVRSPGLVFILDDDLAESGGESMAIIVYYCLANMQCSLADEIFEFLPAAMRWNALKEYDKLIIRPARSGMVFITTEKRHGCRYSETTHPGISVPKAY